MRKAFLLLRTKSILIWVVAGGLGTNRTVLALFRNSEILIEF